MLSYLQASLRISHFLTATMKSNPKPLKPSRPIPIASPHKKLKSKSQSHGHPPLASKPPTNTTNPTITSSGRAGPRIGSGQQVRALKSLAGDAGGLNPTITSSGRTGPRIGSGQQVRAMKSLAGDEGGLSDWVSSLSKQGSKGRGRDVEVGDKKKDKRRKESGKSYRAVESGFGVKNVGGGRSERVFGGSREAGRFGRGGKSDMGRGGMRSNVGKGKGKGFGLKDDDDDDDEVETNEPNWYGSFKELMDSDEEEKDEGDDEEEEEDVDRFNKESVLAWRQREDTESTSPSTGDSYLTQSRFDRFSVSASTMKGLKDLGYETMTVVQEATLPVILKGKDVMAKARTGTGKTVAFLLPAIELIAKSPSVSRDQKRPPILVLIVCPTRELACQAAAEADKLLKYHLSLGVQVIIGGTRLSLEQKRMQANPCQIIVATPGRLKDHIDNTSGFAIRLSGLKVLVLDEADHLLEMGFRKDIERIVAAVPKDRQTLLFSATIPPEVKQICHIALKKDYKYINTVQEGSEETHTQVRQSHLVAKMDNHFPLLYSLLKDHIAHNVDYKVLVFCTTAMVTRLIAELLGELNLNVREIHSRKSQSYRTKVSDEFRKSTGLILVTSDVSARGVDYPDVTLVIQLGMPADRQQYIHRLGRTGRKGKEGQGILLLAPFEEFFLSTIKDLPITKAPIPSVDPESKKKLERSLSKVGMQEKETAYQAWLGYYNSSKIGKDKYRLVELANEFSRTMGLDKPPAIASKILGKMGLKNIPGLRSK